MTNHVDHKRKPQGTATRRPSTFALVLLGLIAGGFSHWYIVWLIAAAYGPENLGNYSVVLAGATPIYIFLGFGLRDVYVSLTDAPPWRLFFTWRIGGMFAAFFLLGAYCLFVAPYWGIFAGMAAMKISDGLLDITLARVQRQGRLNLLGIFYITDGAMKVLAISIAAWLSAPVGVLVASAALAPLALIVPATRLSRSPTELPEPRSVSWRRVLSAALPLTATSGLMSLVASIPVWFLEAYSVPREVGRFSAAAYLIVAANLVGASVQTVLITVYRHILESSGRRSMMRAMNTHTGRMVIAAVPAVVLIVLAGDEFLKLVYGDKFGASSNELLAFGLASALCTLGYINAAVMLVLNWYRSQMAVTITSLAGALLPLLIMVNFGTGQWVLAGILSMVGAYLVRYCHSRFLLRGFAK